MRPTVGSLLSVNCCTFHWQLRWGEANAGGTTTIGQKEPRPPLCDIVGAPVEFLVPKKRLLPTQHIYMGPELMWEIRLLKGTPRLAKP